MDIILLADMNASGKCNIFWWLVSSCSAVQKLWKCIISRHVYSVFKTWR